MLSSPARADSPRRLAVLLPMGWSVRNVVFSGVLNRLTNQNVAVDLLLPEAGRAWAVKQKEQFAAASRIEQLSEVTGGGFWGKSFAELVLKSAFCGRNRIGSYQIYRDWHQRRDGLLRRFRQGAADSLGALMQNPRRYLALRSYLERRYVQDHDLAPIRAQLERLRPELLWSTICVSTLEYPYILAARQLNIPVFTSVLSFDNLTSRGVIPDYDYYCVWSERMRRQLVDYCGAPPGRVQVTGTPQFDFHHRQEYHWSRENTLAKLGLPPGVRYFLYTGSHMSLAPEEPQLVGELARRLSQDPRFDNCHLVVRLHPLDDWPRWNCVTKAHPRTTVCAPSEVPSDRRGWAPWTPQDQGLLISSLAHSDACLNIASTTSLDAAMLDRPVICIDFQGEPNSPQDILYAEYGADHYRPLVESGGLRLAKSWNELLTMMQDAMHEPGRDRVPRRRMAAEECGPPDGRGGERVVETILGILGSLDGNRGTPEGVVRGAGRLSRAEVRR